MWIILFVLTPLSFQSSTIFLGWSSVIFTGVEASIKSSKILVSDTVFFFFLMWLKDAMRRPFKANRYCLYGLSWVLIAILRQRLKGRCETQQYIKYSLPLTDAFPLLSDEVPGQLVPHHILSYSNNNHGNIQQI